MASNSAAWLVGEKVKPLEVKEAPYTLPGDDEILVKNAAVAVNPVDWVVQDMAIFPKTYPTIIGSDLAGEVVEVGKSVTKFKKGDRVLGFGAATVTGQTSGSSFQQYTVIPSGLASIIPNDLSFERACVLPLCLATAAAGLYQDDQLHLQYPSLNPTSTNQTLFIWYVTVFCLIRSRTTVLTRTIPEGEAPVALEVTRFNWLWPRAIASSQQHHRRISIT